MDEKDGYVLTRQEIDYEDDWFETINISARELVKELVEHTNGIPLKILVSSCYGANFQDCLELLPNRSKIFTLSDRDTITSSEDMVNETIKGANPKNLEELFILTILSQKVTNNTPIVGIKDNDICVVKKLTELGMESLTSNQKIHSEIFKAITENNLKVKAAVTALTNKIQADHNTDSDRFNSKKVWDIYLDYCDGKISPETVKSIIVETNPLVDTSNIGFIPPFHKLYNKFKAFIENKR